MAITTFTFKELKAISEKYTQVFVKESKTGLLLFTQFGARLLGLYPDKNSDNALWVNENLDTIFANNHPMVGGERLWIAPERSFFYENPRDFEGKRIPSEIDPGEYTACEDQDALIFENTFSLLEYDKNKLFDNSQEKRRFSLLDDPYGTDLPCAGVSVTDTVSVNDTEITICAWTLSQVNALGASQPGTALFPIQGNGQILEYFDPVPAHRLDIFPNYVRYKIDSAQCLKIAMTPEYMVKENPCKGLYVSPSASHPEQWVCVIKRSMDLPTLAEDCVDVSLSNPEGPKGAIQSYNCGSTYSKDGIHLFGELELQLHKGIVVGEQTISSGTHELLAYTGSKGEILELARHILQISEPVKIYS